MWRVLVMCLLHLFRFWLMKYVATPVVEHLVMIPLTRLLLGGDGEDGDNSGRERGEGMGSEDVVGGGGGEGV